MKASALKYTKRKRGTSAADHRVELACPRRCERINSERRAIGDDGRGSVCSEREVAEGRESDSAAGSFSNRGDSGSRQTDGRG
jgi:hypothetical protein